MDGVKIYRGVLSSAGQLFCVNWMVEGVGSLHLKATHLNMILTLVESSTDAVLSGVGEQSKAFLTLPHIHLGNMPRLVV